MNKQHQPMVVGQNSGEGWYEFFGPIGTTHIAYVHANGEIYLPEQGWTDLTHDDWLSASVKGHVYKLVRQSGIK